MERKSSSGKGGVDVRCYIIFGVALYYFFSTFPPTIRTKLRSVTVNSSAEASINV